MGKYLKLRTKLLLISAGTIFIPLTILSFSALKVTANSITDAFRNDQVSTLNKAGATADNMLSELEKTSLLVITNSQLRTFLTEDASVESRWNAYSLLAYLKNSSKAIRSLQLLGNGDRVLTLGNNTSGITQEDRQTADLNNGRVFWRAQEGTANGPDIYMCRLIRNVILPTEHLGYIKVYLDPDTFFNGLYSGNNPTMTYYILDGDGSVLYLSSPASAAGLPGISTLKRYNGVCFFDRENGRGITPYKLSTGDLTLVGVSSLDPVAARVRANALLYFGISLSCFLFCLLLSLFLSNRTLQPLTQLITHMHRLECEDFTTRIALRGDDEISKLGAQFNRMTAKIQSLVEEVYVVSLRRKEAELRALQTQIKPHFLYNTLDLAYWTAQSEKAPMTAEMINSLSQFFRCGLINGSDCTTVENEIEHLRFYITIQHQHNPNFDFNLSVDPETLACAVVKLVLQPLVENAIVHGIPGKTDGTIDVKIFREGRELVYTIEDNGGGINPADIEGLLSGQEEGTRGIGLRNVNDRIQLTFGKSFGIAVKNRPDGGTCIRVTQPFSK